MTKIILTVVLGILPSIIWLYIFLKNDKNPEPKILILLTFLIGVLIIFPVILIERYIRTSLIFPRIINSSLLILFLFTLTEEIFKFSAAYISINNNPEFNEFIDAMVYSIVAALGFATLENLSIIYEVINNHSSSYTIITGLIRFTGAVFLHALCGAIIGFFWAKGLIFKKTFIFIPLGIVVSSIFHFSFDYIIIYISSGTLFSSLILLFSFFVVILFFKNLEKYGKITK